LVKGRIEGKTDMALIKLRKADEAGEEAGDTYINTDQIVEIFAGPKATEVQMADGKTRWVKDSVEAVIELAKAAG
jgi:uncharacterized protein YlzI (FlbEa/FlbD family)